MHICDIWTEQLKSGMILMLWFSNKLEKKVLTAEKKVLTVEDENNAQYSNKSAQSK